MPAWDAACAGAWLHGRCGAHAGAGLVAEDLPVQLRHALRDAALPSRPASLGAAAPRL
jgi:NAD(P)H-hydrate epimerase